MDGVNPAKSFGKLWEIKTIKSGNPDLQDVQHTWDNNGNLTQRVDVKNSQTENYTYDALDRLLSVSGAYTESFTYNAIGNILTKNGATYTYGSNKPHAVTAIGSTTYTYDNNGNMLVGTARTWDLENRLTAVTKDSVSATFVYDGDGSRVKKIEGGVTTIYVNKYYEKTGTTVTTSYYLGGKLVANRVGTTLNYILQDHLGSTSVTASSAGAITSTIRYFGFGDCRNSTGTIPTDKKFTGQRLDSTGLYYYGARYYDATIGRFISADTKVPDPANPQAYNRYAYCINNPLKYTDPSGHGWWSIITDIASIAFDVYQLATDPSWENAGYLALDVTLTCLPVIPAGVGPLAKGVSKTIKFVGKGEKVVEGVDKAAEGVKIGREAEKACKNSWELLEDAKLTKNGHYAVEKKIINEIGEAESRDLDFSTLKKEVRNRLAMGKDGGRSQVVIYSDSKGTKFVIHEVYDSEGNLIHRDFDSVRIESGQMVDAQQK